MHLEQLILRTHPREISQFYRVKLHICRLTQAQGESRIPAHPPWRRAYPFHNVCKSFPLIQMELLMKNYRTTNRWLKNFLSIEIIEISDIMI